MRAAWKLNSGGLDSVYRRRLFLMTGIAVRCLGLVTAENKVSRCGGRYRIFLERKSTGA